MPIFIAGMTNVRNVLVTNSIEKPSVGRLSYDHMGSTGYIFIETPGGGKTVFAEIRGYGAGLPQDANAERLVQLWNEAYDSTTPKGSLR